MRTTTKILFLSFFILLSSQIQALPKAFSASYTVQKSGMSLGTMQSTLSYQNSQYHYHKKTTAKGLAAMLSGDVLIENSDRVVQGNEFISKRYLRHHTSKRKDKKDQFHFSSPTSVQGNFENQPYTLNVPKNTTDLTSLELRLMQGLETNKLSRQYNIVDRGKLKRYNVQKLGTETLDLHAGHFICEKIRITKPDSNVQTILWMAKDLNYFPVRIQHIDDGDVLEARLTSYN